MNIFAGLVHSVFDFRSYSVFRRNRAGKVFLYGLLASVIYIVASMILPMAVTIIGFGGFGNIAREAIPDFRLEDGRLWVEETYDIQQYATYQGGLFLKVDTSRPITEEITDVDLLAFDQALVLDAEHAIVKAEGSSPLRVSYEDLDLGDWDRESFLKEFAPLVPVFLWIMLLFAICIGILGFFGSALVVAIIGSIMAAITGCRLRFGELYKLAVYARTPALVLEIVYAWIPFSISYFYVINYGFSAIYMWKALQHIKKEELNLPGSGPAWPGSM